MPVLPKHFTLLFLLLILVTTAFAGSVSGTVTDEKGKPLPFSSITVKNTSRGVIANSYGSFAISLPAGEYTLVCQHVGYKTVEKIVSVGNSDQQQNFVLPQQDLAMAEVVIRRGEDPALEIMRQAIKKRNDYNKQVDSFTVDVYIKGLIR
ncbi:MAG TPA: carboxypeptidase-like regulatory domain-containing protein [Flavisolibacter sp.]|nr:carboxypeptidase-like regulatory domain-containing protein [Flavisolibacter sp.]